MFGWPHKMVDDHIKLWFYAIVFYPQWQAKNMMLFLTHCLQEGEERKICNVKYNSES